MNWLQIESESIEHLKGVVIVQLPDCVVWKSWQSMAFDDTEIAAYFGDMVKAQRQACQSLNKGLQDLRFSIESDQLTLLVSELAKKNYVAVFVFSGQVALGLARYTVKRLSSIIAEHLPDEELVTLSPGRRVIAFIERYAPDPHAVMMRIALQTKIPFDRFNDPDNLTAEELMQIELAAQMILGVSNIRF